MRKVILILTSFCFTAITLHAQDEEHEKENDKGFKKENLFTGGSISISFFNGQTLLGANPMLGYKIAEWVDAGLAFNYVYNGYKDYPNFGDKVRQTTIGPGVFARLYPVHFLFVQGQFERNFITQKYLPDNSDASSKFKVGVNSLLLGAGFAQGREEGSNTFFYLSVLVDVLKDQYSPYVNVSTNPDNPSESHISLVPVIRAGVNIGLFQKKYGRYDR
jgi:hypothetical protein